MSRQLAFDLPHRAAMGREDFFVSPANAAAVAGIEAWRDWPLPKMVLAGPPGAGKTHLAHVWAGLTDATVIAAADLPGRTEALLSVPALAVENAERIAGDAAAEEALFHLHNALEQRGAPLLLTAWDAPERWHLGLPDLASRMAQAGLLRMSPPDEPLLSAVMLKLAHDRGLAVTPATVTYALGRIDRSFAAAGAFIAALDARALELGRKPTRDLARLVLDAGAGGDLS
ncbi:chromosomal replication initiator DnaA [Rhodobacterales bacterium HKCCE2091]|nr:chromosomal replication initiator DnaA [Rhodobacterales bacterium HKCCE2091]